MHLASSRPGDASMRRPAVAFGTTLERMPVLGPAVAAAATRRPPQGQLKRCAWEIVLGAYEATMRSGGELQGVDGIVWARAGEARAAARRVSTSYTRYYAPAANPFFGGAPASPPLSGGGGSDGGGGGGGGVERAEAPCHAAFAGAGSRQATPHSARGGVRRPQDPLFMLGPARARPSTQGCVTASAERACGRRVHTPARAGAMQGPAGTAPEPWERMLSTPDAQHEQLLEWGVPHGPAGVTLNMKTRAKLQVLPERATVAPHTYLAF